MATASFHRDAGRAGEQLSKHLLVLHSLSTKGPVRALSGTTLRKKDLLLLQVWPLQEENFLLVVPSTFRRNPKCSIQTSQLEELPQGCCSVNGRTARWNLVLLDLSLSLPEGSQGRLVSLEAQTRLALSSPTPQAGISAKSLPGNLYTAPSEEIKEH